MPAVRRHWTAEEVRELQNESRPWPRYEVIGGELFVTPAPAMRHQLIVTELARVIGNYLANQPVGVMFVSPADLELEPGAVTQPDVFVVPVNRSARASEPRWTDIKALMLAIEVISPSSVRIDRTTKREYYINAGVSDYVVVDAEARSVEHWTTGRETPETIRTTFVWSPAGASEPLIVSLPDLLDHADAQLRRTGLAG